MGTLTQLPTHQPVPDGYYSAPEVCNAAGITYRQLDFWTRCGLIHADNGDQPGAGYRRLYSAAEFDVACHLADLAKAGMRPTDAEPIARTLARGQPARLGPYTLTTTHQEDSST